MAKVKGEMWVGEGGSNELSSPDSTSVSAVSKSLIRLNRFPIAWIATISPGIVNTVAIMPKTMP